jgi:hypothetical protein
VIVKKLDESVWNTLLSILLCITGPILADKTKQFATSLSQNLTYTLFDIWIRSKTFNVQLWDELTGITRNWMRNHWLVDRWTSVCRCFSKKVIKDVFRSGKPLMISYNLGPEEVEHNFTDE